MSIALEGLTRLAITPRPGHCVPQVRGRTGARCLFVATLLKDEQSSIYAALDLE